MTLRNGPETGTAQVPISFLIEKMRTYRILASNAAPDDHSYIDLLEEAEEAVIHASVSSVQDVIAKAQALSQIHHPEDASRHFQLIADGLSGLQG